MQEIWKDIAGAEGFYETSNLGKVRSKDRIVIGRRYVGKELAAIITNNGYVRAGLSGKGGVQYVHRLVAQAFLPNPSGFTQVNHINGDKTDNRAVNLEWCNNGQNQQHAYDHLGKSRKGRISGEAHYNSRFSDAEIIAIRDQKGSAPTHVVAAQFNTSSANVSLIWNNKTRKSCLI